MHSGRVAMDPTPDETVLSSDAPSPAAETSGAAALWANALGAPVVALMAILLRRSFAGFLFEGFHTWIHEFGHATFAWLSGHRALPLPIGWTNIAPEKSLFVYVGGLFLLGLLGFAGWRERKPAAVALAASLIGMQALFTWIVPAREARMWITFGGVGGEFYLSALMLAAFFVDLPDKFRWSICRWVFLFIGAASFFQTYTFWRGVAAGRESIPYGSMIGGEDDASGDMDALRDDYHWTERTITATYTTLGNACLLLLVGAYLVAVAWAWGARRRPVLTGPDA